MIALGERRASDRCPVCYGPTKADMKFVSGLKCRNSLCSHNHQSQVCPRCGTCEAEAKNFVSGKYHYSCGTCQATWQV